MNYFEGIDFFVILGFLAVPAIILGLLEKNIKYYGFLATLFLLYTVKKDELVILCGYLIYQLILVYLLTYILKKYVLKNRNLYWIFIFLALLPLMLSKISVFILSTPLGFLGISYLTFKSIQLIIEIYDGEIQHLNCFDILYFLVFFPTISSGPIDRSRRFISDCDTKIKRSDYIQLLSKGLIKITAGIFYKFIIAFVLYHYMNKYGLGNNFSSALIYMYLYGFYLFFDFAGYSLMAIGTSYIFGIKTPDNFNKPFLSVDIKDFWNRWHMTLSFWFRDFVFTRIVINFIRNNKFKTKLMRANVAYMINMTLMGVWHGLTPSYILYGFYHGLLLALNDTYQKKSKFYKRNKNKNWYKFISWAITFNLIMFGLFIFSGRFLTVVKYLIN